MVYRMWRDYPELCPLYLGIESFTNTAIIFFIVALNLHAVSTYNLACKTIDKRTAKSVAAATTTASMATATEKLLGHRSDNLDAYIENGDGDDSGGSSSSTSSSSSGGGGGHDSVANDSSYEPIIPSRSLTIDYSKPKNRISVTLPVLFIWFLAISMAIPLFVYGNVLPSPENPKVCGLVQLNRSNSLILQVLLMKMRIVVPTVFMLATTIYVAYKLVGARKRIRPCGLEEDVLVIMKLALALSIAYILFSMHRIFGSMLFELISRPLMEYKYPRFGETTGMVFCMVHHLMPAIRPILYCCFEPNLWRDMKRNWCCCLLRCCCCCCCCACGSCSNDEELGHRNGNNGSGRSRTTKQVIIDSHSRYGHK